METWKEFLCAIKASGSVADDVETSLVFFVN